MFACKGICSECRRCIDKEKQGSTPVGKEGMLVFPKSFAADNNRSGLGIAIDMGTTTVAGSLWNLENGELIAASSERNPQAEFGADVISRIAYCGRKKEKLTELQCSIIRCVNHIIADLRAKAAYAFAKSEDPYDDAGDDMIIRVCLCGNTTMSHIFAGYSPASLAFAPFHPAYTGSLRMTGQESMLKVADDAEVTVLPNIAGHVGGDITAGILASGILDMDGLTVLVDLGTNGEIVIKDGDKICACSTAAGPAFEGSERMRGSELIKTISDMLDAGQIDETGRLQEGSTAAEPEIEAESAEKETAARGTCAAVRQKDIRDVQLAKAAIRAGIEIMLKHFGKTAGEIDRIILAGAFGNYIDKKSAVRIGLLPEISAERIISAGNTAGTGAAMALMSAAEMKLAESIPGRVQHVELAEDPVFQKIYIGSMNF